jgi:L,D-peptidoglycan transpeptidase YkuD (ErfK/YbiS/YcfS/YnhG family)
MSADFIAHANGRFLLAGRETRCSVGRSGVIAGDDKREGDGFSPAGTWPMRRVFYRPDRLEAPKTLLPLIALTPEDGWCDAPEDPLYNRWVKLPYAASHEKLWLEDHVYDVIVELGYNDDPPVPPLGSAIFPAPRAAGLGADRRLRGGDAGRHAGDPAPVGPRLGSQDPVLGQG